MGHDATILIGGLKGDAASESGPGQCSKSSPETGSGLSANVPIAGSVLDCLYHLVSACKAEPMSMSVAKQVEYAEMAIKNAWPTSAPSNTEPLTNT